MGLIIKSEINTDRGTTSQAYLNIKKITFRKGGGVMITSDAIDIDVNLYVDYSNRESDPASTASSQNIPRYFGAIDAGSPGDLSDLKGSLNVFEFAYSKVKEELERRGLEVERD